MIIRGLLQRKDVRGLVALAGVSAILLVGVMIGVILQNRYDLRFRLTAALHDVSYNEVLHDRFTVKRLIYAKQLKPTPCPKPTRTAVILAIGQSNAANYVVGRNSPGPSVFSFLDGECFEGADPLPGATGDRGSVWSRVGENLIAQQKYSSVIIAPVAVADTTMEMWAPGGVLFPLVEDRIADLKRAGLNPTHVIVQQGESDSNKTSLSEYRASAVRLLRTLKVGSPIYFALSSGCGRIIDKRIRAAQIQAIRDTGSLKGIDMDTLGPEYRANICHLNESGAELAARRWTKILQ